MTKTQKLWAVGIAVLLGNCFLGACISAGYNPLKALSYSLENPSFLAVFLAGGLGGYFIFAALTSVFTVLRRSYRQKSNAWSNFFVISTAVHLLVLLLNQAGSPEKGNEAMTAPRPASAATTLPTSTVASHQRSLTEYDLRAMAEAQNKTLPTKTSPNLELTRIDAGPGMKLTYQVRVTADGVSKATFSNANIATVRSEAIKDGSAGFKAGLDSGVTYVMSYNATDGTNMFNFPIVVTDC